MFHVEASNQFVRSLVLPLRTSGSILVSLTLGDDHRWVEEKVSHQLRGQLVEEAAGDRPIENGFLVLHHIDQRDGRRARLLGHALDLRINIFLMILYGKQLTFRI